ncbi:MAG: tRNA uridine-5-carboxymethylaminomethyl(34) synthesis GTPase MnmE [bacterium]
MSRINSKDTICAISTPMGTGGVGIVRMSGTKAMDIANKIFVPVSDNGNGPDRGYKIRYGKARDPEDGQIIDEVLLTVMRAPKTYTREDVVEINCHAGPVVLKKILMTLVALGARLADPGEFTLRAFLNGRIDLAQAEAVMTLVSAKTEAALRSAVQQLSGEFSEKIGKIKSDLIHILSEVEAAIDFPEEDLDLIKPDVLIKKLMDLIEEVGRLIESAKQGKILIEGIATAIVGKANVGKSSLLNRLLMEDRAIVTPFPGTTRDVIEAMLNIHGILLRIQDTAGIRESGNLIEQEGIKRSRESIQKADLVLMVMDGSKEPDDEDVRIARMLTDKDTVLILNKMDLVDKKEQKCNNLSIIDIIRPKIILNTSILYDLGVNELKTGIAELFFQGKRGHDESPVVTNVRHVSALNSAEEALQRVLQGAGQGLSEEFLSVDLRGALAALGQITGETTTDDILNEIFSGFCVGK